MVPAKRNRRVCEYGHRYYKSSDCPACPVCEEARKPDDGFLSLIPAPARRALERAEIKTVQALAKWSEQEILDLHGMGLASIPKLRKALLSKGLSFRN